MEPKKNNVTAGGWAAVSRSLLKHWIWTGERYTKGQAWVELLLLAEWQDNTIMYRGQLVTKNRGTVNCSLGWLADRWGWNRKTVAAFLDTLQRDGMAEICRGPFGTVITIKNYDTYQPGTGHPNGPENGQGNGHPGGGSYPQDHGQPKNSPQSLRIQGGALSVDDTDGHPEKGGNGQDTGQGNGQQNGQDTGHKLININNNNNFNKQEEGDRLAEMRRRRDQVNSKWRADNE